jgi:hypothetical protein
LRPHYPDNDYLQSVSGMRLVLPLSLFRAVLRHSGVVYHCISPFSQKNPSAETPFICGPTSRKSARRAWT